MKYLLVLFTFISSLIFSQERIETAFNVATHVKGGKPDLEYVIQSQMVYPQNLLKKNVKAAVTVHFIVLSDGSLKNIEFKEVYKEEFQNEVKRLLRYFIFEPALMGDAKVASETSLTIKFDPALYRKYTKSRGFIIHKEAAKFDTSFVIYKIADSSPDYYKGEAALNEYILSNLEYPDLAKRQGLQGTVVISFIVEPNGTLSNLYVEKDFNHLCTNEALRLLRDTKWKPGTKDGKSIRYRSKYPIVFNINNTTKDNSMGEQR
jgi:TonB family protein